MKANQFVYTETTLMTLVVCERIIEDQTLLGVKEIVKELVQLF